VKEAAIMAFGPPPKRTPKQSYVDAHAITLIEARRRALSSAHYAGKLIKWSPVKATFIAWARKKAGLKRTCVLEFIQPWVMRLRIKALSTAKKLQRQIAVHLGKHYSELVEIVAEEFAGQINGSTPPWAIIPLEDGTVVKHNVVKVRHSAIKTLTTVRSKQHAFLADMHGNPAASQRGEDEAVADYFTSCYAANRTTFESAVALDKQTLGGHLHASVNIVKDAALVPPETAVRTMFSSLNGSKALSESGCGPDLYKVAARQLAALYHPLYVKSVSLTRLGATWELGMAHPLDKKPNATGVRQKRDIRLECPPQKKLGSWLRRAAMPSAAKAVRETQFGSGLNNGSTEMAYLRQVASEGAAESRNLTSISLYADIASAFAEVQRCLVIDDMSSRDT